MKLPTITLPEKVKEFSGVIYFIVILLTSNYFWKFTVIGSDTDLLVTFFDVDISAPFIWLSSHVAHAAVNVLHFLGLNSVLEPGNTIRNENGYAVRVIWSCSGLKQAYILFCIIAFCRGPWKKKLWYIPLGILCVYIFNLIRVVSIIGLIQYYPEWFDILHEQIFKYLFYVMIFGIWVFWEEKYALKARIEKQFLKTKL